VSLVSSDVATGLWAGTRFAFVARWGGFLLQLRRKPLGLFGGAIVALMLLVALAAPVVAPYDYRDQSRTRLFKPPGPDHLMGTDNFGRDIFSRIIWGAQTSLYVGLVSVGVGTSLGSLVGLISGYAMGKVDFLLQRFMDMLMAFPTLILAIATVAMLGPTTTNVVVAIAIVFIPTANRVVRGAVLTEKENQYVEAARTVGCGTGRIIFRHILPNVTAPIIVIASISLGTAILVESSLSFLGLGPPPPAPVWGGMLSTGARTFFERAPWMAIFPGIAISLGVLGLNLLGDAVRDLLDPRLRGR